MMMTRYINAKTATAYQNSEKGPDGHDKQAGTLIFGDEVTHENRVENGRRLIQFRGYEKWVDDSKLGDERALEIYFIDVGTGDATWIVTPAGKTILIHGGLNRRALGFLAWKYRLHKTGRELDVDLMVLTHPDDDHLHGLAPIIGDPQVRVHRVVHSGIATFANSKAPLGKVVTVDNHKYLVGLHDGITDLAPNELSTEYRDFYEAVRREETKYGAVNSDTGEIDIGDSNVKIEVLGPRLIQDPKHHQACLPWLGSEGKTVNGHSVVMRLTYKNVSVLLPGDINEAGAKHLLADGAIASKLDAHVFKAPHHGSHDFLPEFISLARPQIAVISSGDDRDHGHPRAVFTGAIGRASRSDTPLVFSTEIAGRFVEAGGWKEDAGREKVTYGRLAKPAALFKRNLHGMINVRTDGTCLYAARRVAASYQWEAYGPMEAMA
ncbi:MAG: hypothetical protein IPK82_35690 [Polyangiaceae bacterium]|nr:hypothetical protein [Polyangiaceae bacterium]